MRPISFLRKEFAHPRPAFVIFTGLSLWLCATVWGIFGGIISQLSTLSFILVGLIAALIGALGTVGIAVGGMWYGVLIFLDYRAERL